MNARVEVEAKRRALFARTSTATLIAAALRLEHSLRSVTDTDKRLSRAWICDELERRGGGVTDDEAFCELLDQGMTYTEALLVTFPHLTDGAQP